MLNSQVVENTMQRLRLHYASLVEHNMEADSDYLTNLHAKFYAQERERIDMADMSKYRDFTGRELVARKAEMSQRLQAVVEQLEGTCSVCGRISVGLCTLPNSLGCS